MIFGFTCKELINKTGTMHSESRLTPLTDFPVLLIIEYDVVIFFLFEKFDMKVVRMT